MTISTGLAVDRSWPAHLVAMSGRRGILRIGCLGDPETLGNEER